MRHRFLARQERLPLAVLQIFTHHILATRLTDCNLENVGDGRILRQDRTVCLIDAQATRPRLNLLTLWSVNFNDHIADSDELVGRLEPFDVVCLMRDEHLCGAKLLGGYRN
jgi:hypothetical protein